ncbi:putative quinol monooxygenase [Neorhizobium sp. JUb45]|uniref:putative quinol monooxygenase n=1 Tax=Neorhizobium sp. JUb45 TaxID=2485113 RepID=UPI0010D107F7|nr:putative quinol monooxygenase [Neorhizobium sp. JUb45]TCQ99094.1 quinol monooxygenase YgiN [Neorhizobium sp. JUb45]
MSDQFALSVTFHVKPEHVEEFARRVKENVTETRKDNGVIVFNFHKVASQPTWVLYEIWEREHHSDIHRQKPDVQEFFAQWDRLLSREPEIYRLEPSA